MKLFLRTKYEMCEYYRGNVHTFQKHVLQAFDYIQIQQQTVSLFETTGTTKSGNNYWISEKVIEDYHAIEYDVYVRISNEYYLNLTLCVDKNNSTIIYDIIDSIKLY